MKWFLSVFAAAVILFGCWGWSGYAAAQESDSAKPAAKNPASRAARKAREAKKKAGKKMSPAERAEQDDSASILTDAEPAAESEEDVDAEPVEMTEAEKAEFRSTLRQGTVPDFSKPEGEEYNIDTEDEFYNESIQNRRSDEAFPTQSLILRRYSDILLNKYDFNRDGVLQESEWSRMPGKAQSIDMNGDFVLEGYEILYYLGRYAKDRTIFKPVPPVPAEQQHILQIADRSVLIRPLSAKVKTQTKEEAEKAEEEEELSDLSEEELEAMVDESDEAVGTVDDPELFGLLAEEMDESKQREYAAPLPQIQDMPVWFLSRDMNGDGQLSLREFAPGLSLEATSFFGKLDTDADGLLTPDEVRRYIQSGGNPGGNAEGAN